MKKSNFKYKHFVSTPDLFVIYKMVLSGAGYGILPSLIVKTQNSNTLTLANPNLPQYKDQIFLAYRKETLTSNSAKLIAEICKNIGISKP